MMEIEKQFNRIAEEYDSNRRSFIPCFDAYYAGATDFIAANIRKPSRILDLGAGTGLLTSFWYKKFPDAEFVLVDVADEMLNVARRRFAGLRNVTYMTMIASFPRFPFIIWSIRKSRLSLLKSGTGSPQAVCL